VSFNSSASFLPDSQEFPSLTENTISWDFDDDELAMGLEFPDIDKDYHSSTDSLNTFNEKTEKSSQKRDSIGLSQQRPTAGSHQVKRRAKKQTPMTSSRQTNVATDGSDFELLDRSEIDDMDETIEDKGRASAGTGSSLGAFVGKWLGL
jgi:hypothetical protein